MQQDGRGDGVAGGFGPELIGVEIGGPGGLGAGEVPEGHCVDVEVGGLGFEAEEHEGGEPERGAGAAEACWTTLQADGGKQQEAPAVEEDVQGVSAAESPGQEAERKQEDAGEEWG